MADGSNSCHIDAADPDVAGLGVIIAFLASICVTLVIVLLLYVLEWLPREQYNEVDYALLRIVWRRPSTNAGDVSSPDEDAASSESERACYGHDEAIRVDDGGDESQLADDQLILDGLAGFFVDVDVGPSADQNGDDDVEVGEKNDPEHETQTPSDGGDDHENTAEGGTDSQPPDDDQENKPTAKERSAGGDTSIRGGSGSPLRESDKQRYQTATIKACHQLLVTLADFQLFFGFSVALATYIRLSNVDEFSAYSFKISTTSVWLSCLTHMIVVAGLRRHSYHRAGRGWRAAVMVVLLILLVPLLVLSNLPSFILDPSLSFRCAWNEIPTFDRDQTKSFALVAASIVVTTLSGYGGTIMGLYNNPIHRDILVPRGLTAPRILLLLLRELRASFLWRLLWLLFYLTFGLTSLIRSWTLVSPLKQWSVSFAQLVPLILLASNFPPAYETFCEHVRISDEEPYSESESEDREDESEADLSTPGSVAMSFNLMEKWTLVFLVGITLVLFVWMEFLGLLVGGAFFTAMAESPRNWLGVSIFGFASSVAKPAGGIILTSYDRLQEREQESEQESEQEQREKEQREKEQREKEQREQMRDVIPENENVQETQYVRW